MKLIDVVQVEGVVVALHKVRRNCKASPLVNDKLELLAKFDLKMHIEEILVLHVPKTGNLFLPRALWRVTREFSEDLDRINLPQIESLRLQVQGRTNNS